MSKLLEKLNGPKRLAVLAILLGLSAAFIGTPTDSVNTTVNAKDIAVTAERGVNKIGVRTVADWIIQKKADFRLVDLRPEEKYQEYFIPTAVNIPVGKLLESDLFRNQKIVLYSQDNTKAAEAWFLLQTRDFKGVYIMDGGIKEWKDEILFPKLASNASVEEKAKFDKIKQVSKFFGGSPQGVEEGGEKQIKMPEPEMPAKIDIKRHRSKPKREGC